MHHDTVFRIASMTKAITATAVMMLIEEGRFRLDEPVDRLLPELADRREQIDRVASTFRWKTNAGRDLPRDRLTANTCEV
jgi:CubicO group peptidase (beta-lactamase class C family)